MPPIRLVLLHFDTVVEPSVPTGQNDKIALDLSSVKEFANAITLNADYCTMLVSNLLDSEFRVHWSRQASAASQKSFSRTEACSTQLRSSHSLLPRSSPP